MSHIPKKKYQKPILSIQDQIDLYIKRNLIVHDVEDFLWYLKNVWYYSVWIYAKYFQDNNTDDFLPWTTSSQIIELYKFDKELRTLVFDYIQIIEHSFKTALIREIWEKIGSIAWSFRHTDSTQYSCPWWEFDNTVISFFENIIIKYKNKNNPNYSNKILDYYFVTKDYEQKIPPVWMMMQVMSFGECIRLYNMLNDDNKKLIWNVYDIKWLTLKWWLYNLNNLRNKCAHGDRVRNESFVSSMQIPDRVIWWINYKSRFIKNRKKLYDYIMVIDIIVKQIGLKKSLLQEIFNLSYKYSINIADMWFPWEEHGCKHTIYNLINRFLYKNFKYGSTTQRIK